MSVVDLTSGNSYPSLSAAISASSAGDVIQVPAGTYVENFPNITHNLTIESIGGTAYLSNPQPDPPNGRAVINVPGNLNVSLTVIGLDISGAVDDASNPPTAGGANGAGILFESGNGALLIENCHIHNNEDGILVGATNAHSTNGTTVTIVNSVFNNNGVASTNPRYGYDHNIYVGEVNQFTITGSFIHNALGGNEIKTRALASTIENNIIEDGNSASSYEIDMANGGNDIVEHNIIQKGPDSPQEHVADFGAEGAYAGSTLLFSDNTIVNDGSPSLLYYGAIGLWNPTSDVANIDDNTFYGLAGAAEIYVGAGPPVDQSSGNVLLPLSGAPPLNSNDLFDVPAPGGMAPVMIAAVVYVKLRRRWLRRRNGSAQRR